MTSKAPLFALLLLVTIQLFSTNPPAERPVVPSDLTSLIGQADRLVVLESPTKDAQVLFTSTDRKDIAELASAAVVIAPEPGKGFHCMCIGSPAIRLFRNGKEYGQFTNHHGSSIRCSIWSSDAEVQDREKWLKWFDTRGIPDPRAEVETEEAREKQDQKDEARWLAAMPASLKPRWDPEIKYSCGRSVDWPRLEAALAKEFPATQDRILALLNWYGAGAFQSYEAVAETLLLKYPTPELVRAMQAKPLSPGQLEGAGRLFAGWVFLEKREHELKELPASIKAEVLRHMDGSMPEISFDSDWMARKQAASSAQYALHPAALEAMRARASRGEADAQYSLGICLYEGLGVPKDPKVGVTWLRKAAEQGVVQAQFNHGLCYDMGLSINQSYLEAVAWYTRAAKGGHPQAQYNLGYCYAHRLGIGLNYTEVAKWYRLAAEQAVPRCRCQRGYSAL